MTETRCSYGSAVVTGGASGIGRAIVNSLRGAGVDVVVADRQPMALDEDGGTGGDSGDVAAIVSDVSESSDVSRVMDYAEERFGAVGYLVNCAGILRLGLVTEMTEEHWDEVIRVNLRSTFLCCRAMAKRMVAEGRGGRIVNISSIHAALSEPRAAAYTASKGGIEGFSRTLATEVARYDITVNCIRPGAIRTPLSEPIYTPSVLSALGVRIPQGRVGEPEAISAAVMYLVSDEASYCTGSIITVDGGYSMDGSLPGISY